MSKLSIFCNASLTPEAVEKLNRVMEGRHRVVFSTGSATNLTEGGREAAMAEADVAFGQPHVADVLENPRVRFVQLTSAGYARYDRADLREAMRQRGGAVCSASWVYAEPCAQHALAFMLAHGRQFQTAWEDQAGLRKWLYKDMRLKSRLISGRSTVLLVGYGTIARRLAELLAPFGAKVMAVRREVRGDENVPTYPIGRIDELLPQVDHVVNILPGTAETEQFFHAGRLALCKPTAVFYNIGRGTTVDQYALWTALRTDKLAGAYLDVTNPEPLPADHPLWTAPRCFITPHTAGGYLEEFEAQVDLLVENLGRFQRGEKLVDRVL